MTNTIPNVPRELLERAWRALANSSTGREIGAYLDADPCAPECAETCARASMCSTCSALLSAPSPAGVDGLEVVAYLIGGEPSLKQCAVRGVVNEPLCRLSDAMAIIDGLRGELKQSYQQVNSECMDWAKEYERRKAVQAERDTLKSMLREFAVGISKREMPTEQELNSWFDRIDATLSASKDGE